MDWDAFEFVRDGVWDSLELLMLGRIGRFQICVDCVDTTSILISLAREPYTSQ